MISNETKSVLARGNFWEGIAMYCEERLIVAQKAALASETIDDLSKSKGCAEEIAKLKRLQSEVETFIAAQRPAENKPN